MEFRFDCPQFLVSGICSSRQVLVARQEAEAAKLRSFNLLTAQPPTGLPQDPEEVAHGAHARSADAVVVRAITQFQRLA
jgi:hypothetical protein